MKKNISINISGIIFHIEEDGYEKLKEYLESINRYFSSFDDSREIIADIESRIAEIFLAKLKDGKQVISIEDVDSLMATMGSIKDFQALEEDEEEENKETHPPKAKKEAPIFNRKLYRDRKRKLLGGVLAGIGYYFSIDPLWIRLIFIFLFFGISVLKSIAGFLFLSYIAMWIIIPESDELEEEKKIKKMYRDPDNKVLGGVAGGIAAYFGVDVVIIRLILFLLIFAGGTGFFLYIILWIILPEAKTLTAKMEMQGQPVTLSNIEFNIKKSLSTVEGEENILMKILLFPFRLIAAIFQAISKHLGPLLNFIIEASRVLFGILLSIVGMLGILAILVSTAALIGLITRGEFIHIYPIPFDIIKNDLNIVPTIALIIGLIIPFLFLSILGFIVIMKKKVLKPKIGWMLLAIWIACLLILSFTIPSFVQSFHEEGRYTEVNRYDMYTKTAVLKFNDIGDSNFNDISLNIRSHKDTTILTEQVFTALGKDRKEAIENAKSINYNLSVSDSILTFDSKTTLKDKGRYRNQELEMTIYVPLGQKFILDKDMKNLLGGFLYHNGFDNNQIDGNIWYFTEDGLQCLTCVNSSEESNEKRKQWDIDGYQRNYDIAGFSSLKFDHAFNVHIQQGKNFEVIVSGKRKDVDKVVLDKTQDELEIELSKDFLDLKNHGEINIYLTMPTLSDIKIGGATKVYINNFNVDNINVDLDGAAYAEMTLNVSSININTDGASKLQLSGKGNKLYSKITGASTLQAFDFIAETIDIEVHSASNAKVNASQKLTVKSTGISNVKYRGNPGEVNIEKNGNSSVSKED